MPTTKTAATEMLNQFKPYMLPAALGAAAGGPLMAYFAGKNKIEGETPKQRRHRILRNAILGTTLGGVAGGAIPAGASTILGPARAQAGFHPVDATANTAIKHWGATAAGGVGGALAVKQLGKNRTKAEELIHNLIGKEKNLDPGTRFRQPLNEVETAESIMTRALNPVTNPDVLAQLKAKMSGNLDRVKDVLYAHGVKDPSVLDGLVSKIRSAPHRLSTILEGAGIKNPQLHAALSGELDANPWKARELLGEAGVHASEPIRHSPASQSLRMMTDLKSHLAGHGPVSRLMSKLVPGTEEAAAKAIPNLLHPYRAAELYSNLMRPSVAGTAMRSVGPHFGTPWLVGGVGAGMLGADYLQKKLQGQ